MTQGKESTTEARPLNLRQLAEHLQLSQTTVSLVLNNSPAGRSIPQHTRDRVLEAARRFHYRPNYFAKSLRNSRSMSVGVIVPDLSDGYFPVVMNAIEKHLLKAHYLLRDRQPLPASRTRRRILHSPARAIRRRIAAAGHPGQSEAARTRGRRFLPQPRPWHRKRRSRSRLCCAAGSYPPARAGPRAHRLYARRARHHRRKISLGECILTTAAEMGISVTPELTIELHEVTQSPEAGYRHTRGPARKDARLHRHLLLQRHFGHRRHTRHPQVVGLRIPADISVIGFDDIITAAYCEPPLTTVKQPLREDGIPRRSDPAGTHRPARQGIFFGDGYGAGTDRPRFNRAGAGTRSPLHPLMGRATPNSANHPYPPQMH